MIKRNLFFLLLVLLVSCNKNDPKLQSSNVTTNAEDTEDIKITLDALWDALYNQDLDELEKNSAETFQYFTSRGSKYKRDELMDVHANNLKNFNIVFSDENIHSSEDMAWVTSKAEMNGKVQDQEWKGEFLMTTILTKHNDEWLVTHIHESQSH